jgi:hypothetical protein
MVNTFFYRVDSEGSGVPNDQGIAQAFETTVLDKLRAAQSVSVQYLRIESQLIYPGPATIRFERLVSSLGLINVPALPDAVAAVLRRKTGLAGRAYRGRIYLGGVAESLYNKAVGRFYPDLNNQLIAAAASLAMPLSNPTTGLNAVPIMYHAATPATATEPATSQRVTSIVAATFDEIPRTQRRRQLDRGR